MAPGMCVSPSPLSWIPGLPIYIDPPSHTSTRVSQMHHFPFQRLLTLLHCFYNSSQPQTSAGLCTGCWGGSSGSRTKSRARAAHPWPASRAPYPVSLTTRWLLRSNIWGSTGTPSSPCLRNTPHAVDSLPKYLSCLLLFLWPPSYLKPLSSVTQMPWETVLPWSLHFPQPSPTEQREEL